VLLISLVFCVVVFALLVFILCLVCPIFQMSKDSPFLIVPSVFSKVYSFSTLKIKKLESLRKSQSFGVCKQSYFVFVDMNPCCMTI
jgi:hypothetical protein